jgi:hypothetical protein
MLLFQLHDVMFQLHVVDDDDDDVTPAPLQMMMMFSFY